METLAEVSSALSQTFEEKLFRQANRVAIALGIIQAERGRGKNCSWDIEFDGGTADAVQEGSDIDETEYNTDSPQAAILPWAHYRQSFKLSETELDAAESSMGSAEELLDLFGERVLNAHHIICSKMNADFFSGTGTSPKGIPNLVGIYGGPIEPTGLYAGQSRVQFPIWAGNVLGNAGVPRPLTIDLMSQLEANIFDACGEPPNLILVSTGVFKRYESFFESVRRIVSDGRGPLEYGAGAAALFYKGIPVIRDRNATVGRLAMLNTNYIRMKYLPTRRRGDAAGYADTKLEGSSGNTVRTATDIPARIILLAKTGDNVKASVKSSVQLVVKRPNACGYIADILEG